MGTIIVIKPEDNIAKLVAKARPGDTVVLKPGTYRDTIEIPPGVKIKGMEKAKFSGPEK